jgi:hypothetical protein
VGNDGYFAELSLTDWIGMALAAPLALALLALVALIVIGCLGSRARRRRAATGERAAARNRGSSGETASRLGLPSD